ncbi:MAG: hypothetical protein GYB67_04600 [Chloroflexi bacterium]|nr:hypothetical protein [Chloroflexota bacterium]
MQFRTTHGDHMQHYYHGHPPQDDLAARPAEIYSGFTDLYCPACFEDWQAAKIAAFFQTLAAYTDQGVLVIRPQDQRAPLTPDELLQTAQWVDAERRKYPGPAEWGWRWLLEIGYVAWQGQVIFQADDTDGTSKNIEAQAELHEYLEAMTDSELKRAGWVGGINPFDNALQVVRSVDGLLYVDSARLAAQP